MSKPRHINAEFDAELKSLREQVLAMGSLVDRHVGQAVSAMVERDPDRARRVIEADRAVNQMELAIDEQCIRVLALHQPAASDLRFIAAALKMVTDLERIGDLAVNMAERVVPLCAEPPLRAVDGFSRFLQGHHSSQLNSEAHDCLDRICDAAGRMDQLLKGLLNLAQVGRTTLRSRPVNLSALAAAVVAELQESEPQRVVRFTIAPNLRVQGDPDLLRSVLQNLIGNAWKYTSKRERAHIRAGANG